MHSSNLEASTYGKLAMFSFMQERYMYEQVSKSA